MAIRPIVWYGDPVLREKSAPIETIDQSVRDLVTDMIDTLRDAEGIGLAANQVGVAQRLFIIDLAKIDPVHGDLVVFINPEIHTTDGACELEEGCLSFPDIYQKITRAESVRVTALDLDGNEFTVETDGMYARAILHEYDHIEGVLFIDHISPFQRTLLRGRLKRLQQQSVSA